MATQPLLPRADFLRVLETIRANTNNPKILDATYSLELMSNAEPVTDDLPELKLTPRERRLFNHLNARKGKYFTREALLNAIYFDTSDQPEPKIIDVFACKLRPKLVEYGLTVENRRDLGFRLTERTEQHKDPRVEWHGIVMGRKMAQLSELLSSRLGRVVPYDELAAAASIRRQDVAAYVNTVRKHLPHIESVNGCGYRMTSTQSAQKAA